MDTEPLVRVVRGTPTDLELAALVALVAAGSTPADAPRPRPAASSWTRSARPSTSFGSWRQSALPH